MYIRHMANSDTIDLLQNRIYPNLNWGEILSELNPKDRGAYYLLQCPQCRKQEAFLYKDKQFISCNRRNKCGHSVSVWNYIKEKEGFDNKQTLEFLASKAGIELPRITEKDSQVQREKDSLYAVFEKINQYYRYMLTDRPEGEPARAYLQKREIVKAMHAAFSLGYALPSWDHLIKFLKSRSYSEDLISKCGIGRYSKNGRFIDFFRNRLMIPIHDFRGRVIAFGGRSLDGSEPKYINTPETMIFSKRDVLFNLHQAADPIRRQESAVLMEGYFDVIAAHQRGVRNTVATLGTAFTLNHALILKRYAKTVYIAFDGDPAGIKAAERAVLLLYEAELTPKIIMFPDGSDPADYLRDHKREDFEDLQNHAWDAVDLLFYQTDMNDADTRRGRLRRLFAVVNRIKGSVDRELILKKAAVTMGVNELAVMRDFDEFQTSAQENQTPSDTVTPATRLTPPTAPTAPDSPAVCRERELSLLAFFYRYTTIAFPKIGFVFASDFTEPAYAKPLNRMLTVHLDHETSQTDREESIRRIIADLVPEATTFDFSLYGFLPPDEDPGGEKGKEDRLRKEIFLFQIQTRMRIHALQREINNYLIPAVKNPDLSDEERNDLANDIQLRATERVRLQNLLNLNGRVKRDRHLHS
jgi:DNA primase